MKTIEIRTTKVSDCRKIEDVLCMWFKQERLSTRNSETKVIKLSEKLGYEKQIQ